MCCSACCSVAVLQCVSQGCECCTRQRHPQKKVCFRCKRRQMKDLFLQETHVAVLQCCSVAVLQCCSVAVLQCCSDAVLQCCSVAVLQCCQCCWDCCSDTPPRNTCCSIAVLLGVLQSQTVTHALPLLTRVCCSACCSVCCSVAVRVAVTYLKSIGDERNAAAIVCVCCSMCCSTPGSVCCSVRQCLLQCLW